ncbi:MinD/ParA family ATP-binding protein [Paraburkholderia bryophila]|uniref:Flagellar biosynthesis protein FlhG n=1 Tax=Paraburkholderia bryophila TaxID=420952 RepID=A0A7Y9WB91_9BURK|nr:MinD/ParA family protein [Paraburkholderia bryophila]NYH17654.1 flagellar biosynthesis protein FlhG [Paraburkholderia bryophila]NYH23198.1 flagellar biosynthesis protein FlhG [Paraburkholderia bryophila]
MDKLISDQAEGLRRLLARSGSRVIAVTGGSTDAGCTTTVVNLAAALAQQGKDVLVIDECLGELSVSAMLGGLRGAGNFAAVMRGEMALDDAAARHALGFSVLAASRLNREGHSATQFGVVLHGSADVVLIDAQLDSQGHLSPLAKQAHDVMIVTRMAAQAITEAYACMKRLHYAHALAQFRVLVNHVQSPGDAHTAFANLAGVAGRYLTVALEDAGCITADARMARALELSRCVVDAFPSTPAARDFRQLAAELQYWPMRPAMSSQTPWMASATVTAAQHADQPSAQHA